MNHNGKIAIKDRYKLDLKERMDVYDNLCPEMRELFRNAPFLMTVTDAYKNVKVTSADIARFKQRLNDIQKESTTLTYGSAHPQSL
jgi:hypothetical protein